MKIFCIIACMFFACCGDSSSGNGDGGNGGGGGSCSSVTGCTDYTGSMWTTEQAQSSCGQIPDSTYSSSACPTADLVGSCKMSPGTPGEFIVRYYPPTFDATSAEAACAALQGTWIP